MEISIKDLKSQYNRVKKAGWLPHITAAAALSGSTTAHWLAFGSRESNLKNIKGDFRNGIWNGFGPVQVDIGTDRIFAKTWRADSVDSVGRGFRRGAEIYNLKVAQIRNGQGKKLTVRGRSFTGKKPVAADDLRRLATAAYNSGLWSYYHWSNGNNCDSTTTGKNYSRDVYDRAVEFAALLEADGTETGALAKEVKLQGKYATKEALKRAGVSPKKTLLQLPKAEPMDAPENVARAGYAMEEDFGDFTEGERPKETAEEKKPEPEEKTNEAGTLNQKAENIINAGAPAAAETANEAAKIEAVQALPPVEIVPPEPTDFLGKVKKLGYGVVTGTVALPFLDKVFGIQLSPEQTELLKTVFPYFFFGILGSLAIWFVTKKVNNYFVTKLIADKNADVTQRNVVINAPKPLYQINARPHIWARIKYAVNPKPAYLWSDNPITGESQQPEKTGAIAGDKTEPSGDANAPNNAVGKTLNL